MKHKAKQRIQDRYRVMDIQPTNNDHPSGCVILTLENAHQRIQGQLCRQGYYSLTQPLQPGNYIKIRGCLHTIDETPIVILETVQLINAPIAEAWYLIPLSWFHAPGHAVQLSQLLQQITNVALQAFLSSLCSDDTLIQKFLSLPASVRHHHACPGGLLEHSLECAQQMAWTSGLSGVEKQLGILAALLHDIGKVRTQGRGQWAYQQRQLLNHDLLTLEVLAPHLAILDNHWPAGALTLRYLLSWHISGYRAIPAMALAEMVRCADRISAAKDRERQAFAEDEGGNGIVHHDGVTRWQITDPWFQEPA
nr:TraI domain-containing protein [uncultured Desulfuromonas sp.]